MGNPCKAVSHVLVHTRRNIIALVPDGDVNNLPDARQPEPAVLDIGMKGALIGLEIGSDYFAVSANDGAADHLVRSVSISVNVARSEHGIIRLIEIPRRTATYEITYPIGNQCWRQVIEGKVVETCVSTLAN